MLSHVDGAQYDLEKSQKLSDTTEIREYGPSILNLSDRNSSASSLCEDEEFDITKVPEHVQDDEIEDFLRVQSQRRLLKLKLREHFELCFPGDYNGCTLVVDTGELDTAYVAAVVSLCCYCRDGKDLPFTHSFIHSLVMLFVGFLLGLMPVLKYSSRERTRSTAWRRQSRLTRGEERTLTNKWISKSS